MSAATVRAASVADAAVVGRLLHDFNREFDAETPAAEVLASRFETLLASDDQLVVLAEDDGEPVGFGYLTFRRTPYHDGPLAQLEELYVRPGRRDQRVGSALLQRALDVARERGAGEMHINVDEVDTDTRRFYEQRFGFTNVAPGTDYRMLFYERVL
jgi:GNAT superfamily N-acetyltransferase